MIKLFYSTNPEKISTEIYRKAENEMPEQRAKKASAYLREQDRILCYYAYFLLKYAVKDFYGINNVPEIAFGKYNKPFFRDYPEYFFNYSHCSAGVCCAVSDAEVGADIQNIEKYDGMKYVMTENEQHHILNAENPDSEFTKLWTVKESYYKMIGCGLCDTMKENDFSKLHYGVNYAKNSTIFIEKYDNFYMSASAVGRHTVHIEKVSLNDCIRTP